MIIGPTFRVTGGALSGGFGLSNHNYKLGWRVSPLIREIHSVETFQGIVVAFTTDLERNSISGVQYKQEKIYSKAFVVQEPERNIWEKVLEVH